MRGLSTLRGPVFYQTLPLLECIFRNPGFWIPACRTICLPFVRLVKPLHWTAFLKRTPRVLYTPSVEFWSKSGFLHWTVGSFIPPFVHLPDLGTLQYEHYMQIKHNVVEDKRKRKKPTQNWIGFLHGELSLSLLKNGGYLLSHFYAVPSTWLGLTSLFGMGRGGSPTL